MTRANVDRLPLFRLRNNFADECPFLEPHHQIEALARRKELTLCIGDDAEHFCKVSPLWHDGANLLKHFKSGFYSTLNRSFIGYDSFFDQQCRTNVMQELPSIKRLNLLIDITSVHEADRSITIQQVKRLLIHWRRRLEVVRIWLRVPGETEGNTMMSTVREVSFWNAFANMSSLTTLWLDIDEQFSGEGPTDQVEMEHILRSEVVHSWTNLKQIRFASKTLKPWKLLTQIMNSSNLRRVSLMNSISLEELSELRFAKVKEVSLYVDSTQHFVNLSNLPNLTRITVSTSNLGPRFIEILRRCSRFPNLKVMSIALTQRKLFNRDEIEMLTNVANRPKLVKLEVLCIQMNSSTSCNDFSLKKLVQSRGQPATKPFPNLVACQVVLLEANCHHHHDEVKNCLHFSVSRWLLSERFLYAKLTRAQTSTEKRFRNAQTWPSELNL